MTINSDLETLYLDDKKDRILFDKGQLTEDALRRNDTKRLRILNTILPNLDVNEIWNCHYACLLLMHSWSDDPLVFQKAHEFAKKAVVLGSSITKWLYAASLDRWLVSQGKQQKYGTQYNVTTGKILPYDNDTSDQERKEYGVPPLSQLINRHKELI